MKDVEREANIFACCILMPREMILKDLEQPIDLSTDDWVKMMCKKYGVSPAALALRISLLKPKQFKIEDSVGW